MLEIGRQTMEAIIRGRGTGYSGKQIQTPSGSVAEYREDRTRVMKTLMGPVEIQRAYYHEGKGKGGYVPLDDSLCLPQEQYSYAVQEQMSLYAIEDSYGESAKKLCYTFPVGASGSTVGRIIQEHGQEIYQEEVDKVEAIFSHKQSAPDPEGDGAKWIWKQKRLHDPDGKEIVDYIHASEYLQKVANAIHGVDTDKSQRCWGCMKFLLRKCGGEPVLDALKEFSGTHSLKELDAAITYFQNNYSRMDYPAYEEKGYHITSSTTESACRHVVGDRLKRSGMRWTTEGAQYTTMLRLKWKNGKWTNYWMRYRPNLAA